MREPLIKPEGQVHIHLLVSEMKASIDFYVTILGFHYNHGLKDIAWLTRGELLLTLSPGEVAEELPNYFGWSVGSIQQLEEYYARLHARYQRLSAPPSVEEGRAYFFLYDPDGYPIAFSLALPEPE
jgi:catechol 2,3-dioxygenase-like lactoylglutathione lyase family enzyme